MTQSSSRPAVPGPSATAAQTGLSLRADPAARGGSPGPAPQGRLRPAQRPLSGPAGVGSASGPRRLHWASPRAVIALILREMATTYGRSPGGYLWAVLDPVAALAMISFGFSLIFAHPAIGNSFPLFYATGYLPFMLFNDVANKMATSINFSRNLLAYPVVTFLDALLARFILTVLTHLMVGYLVYFALIMFFDARAELNLPVILSAYSLAAALGIGIGTLNCYLMTSFPLWERSWQIATRPLFLISGIFFTYSSMPGMVRDYVWYNPLIHIVGLNRDGFYGAYNADYVSIAYVMGLALICGFFGLLLLWRHYRQLLEA